MIEENQENETPKNEGENQPNDSSESNAETVDKTAYDNQKIRAEKAEKRLKELEAKSNQQTEQPNTPKNEGQSNESDYYKDLTLRTFMKGEGIDDKADQDWILKEANELKKPVEDLLSKPYYQSELKTRRTQRQAENGTPDGSGSSSGGVRNDVDYWIDKKNPKNPGEFLLPKDPELKIKVINARMARDKRNQEFPDESY